VSQIARERRAAIRLSHRHPACRAALPREQSAPPRRWVASHETQQTKGRT
jgi:hypothetical protein